jgi:putative transcriptional regulator
MKREEIEMNTKLIEFRLKLGKTPNEMAEILDVSLSLYYKIEKGSRTPSYNFLQKFHMNFKGEIEELFFEN